MKKIKLKLLLISLLFGLLILNEFTLAQQSKNLFSYKNRLAFGNYLFCQKDYLRAIGEYNWLQKNSWNDSVQFKIGNSYLRMRKFSSAYLAFNKIEKSSPIHFDSEIEKIRVLYFVEDYIALHNKIEKIKNINFSREFEQLENTVMLIEKNELPEQSVFLKPFDMSDRNELKKLYAWKVNPQVKSPTKAAILSAILPGLGKIYTDETSDGITSFLLTGLFTYLAINKFQNNHTESGILYASIATFFYAGNIYGSASAAVNYNAGLKLSFDSEVKLFINNRNQFLPIPKHLCD